MFTFNINAAPTVLQPHAFEAATWEATGVLDIFGVLLLRHDSDLDSDSPDGDRVNGHLGVVFHFFTARTEHSRSTHALCLLCGRKNEALGPDSQITVVVVWPDIAALHATQGLRVV